MPQSRYELSRIKALEIFSQRGFGQVSMRDLAAHMGVNAGSLYHHFPSKQYILFELLEEFYASLNAAIDPCITGTGDRAKLTQRFIKARLALHEKNPFYTRLVQRDSSSLEDGFLSTISRMRFDFGLKLQRLLEFANVSPTPISAAAAHTIAELVIILPDWLTEQPITAQQKSHLAERLILSIIAGSRNELQV